MKTFDRPPQEYISLGGGRRDTRSKWGFISDLKLHYMTHEELGTTPKMDSRKRAAAVSALRMHAMSRGFGVSCRWDKDGMWFQAFKRKTA